MINSAQRIIQRLWSFCAVLRDDGLSYPDYVEQLTFLLFLKMVDEQGIAIRLPQGCRWLDIICEKPIELAQRYEGALSRLGQMAGLLGTIFNGATNRIRDPRKLSLLVREYIGAEYWTSFGDDVLADAYEGLLGKTTDDLKSGAGQYFTPRALVDAIADVVPILEGDSVYDPACGTGGFLLAAKRKATNARVRRVTYRGTEIVRGVARLAAMNALLHGLQSSKNAEIIEVADGLEQETGARYSLILTNPPFGKRSSLRKKLLFETQMAGGHTGNKQLLFLAKVMNLLAPGGRAAIVVPDNVLFEGGAAAGLRRRLLQEFNLHTILRLPTGIFYATGVKANVMFFCRDGVTKDVGIYDLRTAASRSLRKSPLSAADLVDFTATFGSNKIRRSGGRWTTISATSALKSFDASLDVGLPAVRITGERHSASYADAVVELEAAVAIVRDVISQLELSSMPRNGSYTSSREEMTPSSNSKGARRKGGRPS